MSRVGKEPIKIPDGVEITIEKDKVTVKGPKGVLSQDYRSEVSIKKEDDLLTLIRNGETKSHRALHGLYRSLINNIVIGVTKGFQKTLEIVGVGYTAEKKGKALILRLGYSHSIYFKAPEGITIDVPKNTIIKISGCDKQLVGMIAAKIRSFRPPEPYKGKGVKYQGELIRRKAGKTAA